MKVRDLHEELGKLMEKGEEYSEIKIATYRREYGEDKVFYFSEISGSNRNVVACHLTDLLFVWPTSNKDGKEKQVFLLDEDAAENTSMLRNIRERIAALQIRCKKLNLDLMTIKLSKTSNHKLRLQDQLAKDVVVDHQFKAKENTVNVVYEGGSFFFDHIHRVDGNGIGTRDRAQLPSIEGLENFIEVLEALQNE